MDAVDYAVDARELLDELALRSRPGLVRRRDGGIECQECGEDIPEARRLAVPGCPHCVDCQQEIDRRRP